jgi:hypothetical protein
VQARRQSLEGEFGVLSLVVHLEVLRDVGRVGHFLVNCLAKVVEPVVLGVQSSILCGPSSKFVDDDETYIYFDEAIQQRQQMAEVEFPKCNPILVVNVASVCVENLFGLDDFFVVPKLKVYCSQIRSRPS